MKPTALIILMAGLLLGSIAVSVVLYRFAMRTYEQMFRVRLDPNGLAGLDSWTEPALRRTGGPRRIVMFGDSRAQMWPTPDLPPHHELINRGSVDRPRRRSSAGSMCTWRHSSPT